MTCADVAVFLMMLDRVMKRARCFVIRSLFLVAGAECSAASFSRAMTGGCGAVFELLTHEKVGLLFFLVGDVFCCDIGMITITTAILRIICDI